MTTHLQMLIVPADPSRPCRLDPYIPAELDDRITAELGADRYHRTALSVRGEFFHTVRAADRQGASLNTRVCAYVHGGHHPLVQHLFHGDIIITGRVRMDALGLIDTTEFLPLDPTTLAHFMPTPAQA